MRSIDNNLRVSHIVQRGDNAMLNAQRGVDDLDYGCDAICRTGRGRDQMVLRRVIQIVIATHDNIECTFLDGSRDDNLLDATIEVGLQRFRGSKLTRTLHDDVYANVVPRNITRGILVRKPSLAVSYLNRVLRCRDTSVPTTMNGIELQ